MESDEEVRSGIVATEMLQERCQLSFVSWRGKVRLLGGVMTDGPTAKVISNL